MTIHTDQDAGTCQRCGFHPGRDPAQACRPQVIYIPSRRTVWDYIAPNGKTFFGQKTLAEVQLKEGADAVILSAEEGYRLKCEAFRKPVSEITEERFHEMLNILPPCRWQGMGEWFESFHMSEAITGNIVSWFIRWRTGEGDRYFTLDDYANLRQYALADLVSTFAKGARHG